MSSWLHAPLSRIRYAAWGLVLSALKIATDFAIATRFDRPYSVLFYVSPIDAPLLHPDASLPYWRTLALTTTPFVAIGIALTVRRLRDAAMSPWFALLFFVPFANLLFFATMALAPSRTEPAPKPMPAQAPYRAPGLPLGIPVPPLLPKYPKLTAAAFGMVVGLGGYAFSVEGLRHYGLALAVGLPTIAGFTTGVSYARLAPDGRMRDALTAAAISITLMMAATIAFAIEGLGCFFMFFPLLALPGFFGAFVGFGAGQALPPRHADATLGASMLSFFALLGAERMSPLEPLAPEPVVSTIEIDAPPGRVWPLLPAMAELPPPEEWIFRRAGIAYPLRAAMIGQGVGATRVCDFTTGTVKETIDRWEPARALGFTIDAQPDPMRELTLYEGIRQPHLDGAVRNVRGELLLEPLSDGRSRVTAKSWYRVSLAPEPYWRAWSDVAIRAIHRRVLTAVKGRAEEMQLPLAGR
jgi:uncharacterized membrane protein YhaH (DUF805 family)